jgi:hypothetical protein
MVSLVGQLCVFQPTVNTLLHLANLYTLLCAPLQASCKTINLRDIPDKEWKGDWVQLKLPLNEFNWSGADKNEPFYSCSNSLNAWYVNQMVFK